MGTTSIPLSFEKFNYQAKFGRLSEVTTLKGKDFGFCQQFNSLYSSNFGGSYYKTK